MAGVFLLQNRGCKTQAGYACFCCFFKYKKLHAVMVNVTMPVSKNQLAIPQPSATGPEIKSPTGMARDITLPIREKARPCACDGMVSCI